jgi:hypothetical protein
LLPLDIDRLREPELLGGDSPFIPHRYPHLERQSQWQ